MGTLSSSQTTWRNLNIFPLKQPGVWISRLPLVYGKDVEESHFNLSMILLVHANTCTASLFPPIACIFTHSPSRTIVTTQVPAESKKNNSYSFFVTPKANVDRQQQLII